MASDAYKVDPAETACANCRFWRGSSTYRTDHGLCQRHAPTPVPDSGRHYARELRGVWAAWPVTMAGDFCGDFERADATLGHDPQAGDDA